jgi:hypothetical protein
MPVTRFNDAVLALLGACRAASPFSAPGGGGVPVYDGLRPMTGSDPDFLIVGHDGTLEADGTLAPDALAGTYLQQNLEMTGVRSEAGSVNCVLVCQSGDAADAAGRRQRAALLLSAAEDAAAASGGYPAAAPGIMFDGTSDGRWVNRLSLGGVAVLVAYRVSYSTEWD